MRYICLALLITGSAALTGCFGDNDNNNSRNNDVAPDQANAELAVKRVNDVIGASQSVDIAEPQDIDRIILPEANRAEPVAVTGTNASL